MFLKPYPSYDCPNGDGRDFMLRDYLYNLLPNGDTYRIIPHTMTDGGSVPRVLWIAQAPFGPEWMDFVFHDGLYGGEAEKKLGNNSWLRVQLPFDECNELFLISMLDNGISKVKAEALYYAVKEFGQKAFSDDLAKPITLP